MRKVESLIKSNFNVRKNVAGEEDLQAVSCKEAAKSHKLTMVRGVGEVGRSGPNLRFSGVSDSSAIIHSANTLKLREGLLRIFLMNLQKAGRENVASFLKTSFL